jgi:hypothetical protein
MGNNQTKTSNVPLQSKPSKVLPQPDVFEIVSRYLRVKDMICLLLTSKSLLNGPKADEIIWNTMSQYETEGTINSFIYDPFWMPRLTKAHDAHHSHKSKKSRRKAVSHNSVLLVTKTKSPRRKAISQGPSNGTNEMSPY